MCPESEQELSVSMVDAAEYVQRVKRLDTSGFGDDDNALRRFASMAGLSYWTVRRIDQRKAKTIRPDVLTKVRLAYIQYCQHLISTLQTELTAEANIEADNADLASLLAETEELAAKAAKARAKLKSRGRA